MTDVQSQKSAEELPNMHASANWVSWQGTTGLVTNCFNIIFDCSIRVSRSFCNLGCRAQQAFGMAWALPGHPCLRHCPHPRSAILNLLLFARCNCKGNFPKAA